MPTFARHGVISRWHPLARPGFAAVLLGAALALSACAHYRLGTGTQPGFATLYVAPVESRILLPQARAVIGTAIREALLKDGRVTLAASPEAADATLKITLIAYGRGVLASNSADTGLAREFALSLRAACTLTDNRTGKPLFSGREITATRPILVDSGQLQAEYQALPLLATALAGQVTHSVLDVW